MSDEEDRICKTIGVAQEVSSLTPKKNVLR